ncbi:unnamed protein product [Symbiodinium natans]|uniref:Uncharacterized protein n=1 Tax=Symbiodinium natans TaxID=878477 RepID=A0A812QQM4_9DINO|nr:unnamed protein product [Symbiodinium natans]
MVIHRLLELGHGVSTVAQHGTKKRLSKRPSTVRAADVTGSVASKESRAAARRTMRESMVNWYVGGGLGEQTVPGALRQPLDRLVPPLPPQPGIQMPRRRHTSSTKVTTLGSTCWQLSSFGNLTSGARWNHPSPGYRWVGSVCVCGRARARTRALACVHACVRAGVRACGPACVRASKTGEFDETIPFHIPEIQFVALCLQPASSSSEGSGRAHVLHQPVPDSRVHEGHQRGLQDDAGGWGSTSISLRHGGPSHDAAQKDAPLAKMEELCLSTPARSAAAGVAGPYQSGGNRSSRQNRKNDVPALSPRASLTVAVFLEVFSGECGLGKAMGKVGKSVWALRLGLGHDTWS